MWQRIRKWLLQPVYPGRWWRRALCWLAVALRAVWAALEWALGDPVHWRVISRLLLIALVVCVLIAVRQGWVVESKLDWLIKLFAPIFGAQLPKGVTP